MSEARVTTERDERGEFHGGDARTAAACASHEDCPANTVQEPAAGETAPVAIHPPLPSGINLRPFADQLERIAEQLRHGDFGDYDHAPDRTPYGSDQPASPAPETANATATPRLLSLAKRRQDYAAMARATYAVRRKREAIFGNSDLFGEPAWDLLLDLYIAHADQKPVSVSSACIGSAAPPTTGLRWLGVLAEQGYVLRENDPLDQRRVLVRLTEHGLATMDRYFASASSQGGVFLERAARHGPMQDPSQRKRRR